MEASRTTLGSGAHLAGRRLQTARARHVVNVGSRRLTVTAARGRDGGWVTRGTRVIALTFFRTTRQARRAEGIKGAIANALGGARPCGGRESIDFNFIHLGPTRSTVLATASLLCRLRSPISDS